MHVIFFTLEIVIWLNLDYRLVHMCVCYWCIYALDSIAAAEVPNITYQAHLGLTAVDPKLMC